MLDLYLKTQGIKPLTPTRKRLKPQISFLGCAHCPKNVTISYVIFKLMRTEIVMLFKDRLLLAKNL